MFRSVHISFLTEHLSFSLQHNTATDTRNLKRLGRPEKQTISNVPNRRLKVSCPKEEIFDFELINLKLFAYLIFFSCTLS